MANCTMSMYSTFFCPKPVPFTSWIGGSSPSRGVIFFLQLKNHCPARALVEGVVRDRWSPGHRVGGPAGAIPIYMRHPVGRHGERPVYVRVRGWSRRQLIRVIALVMITVLPCSARTRHSRRFWEGLRCSIFGRSYSAIVLQVSANFRPTNHQKRQPKAAAANTI
jgi:hypothetical protein